MPKVSKEDFAGLVRQKFPGVYDDLDDDTLVRAYVQAKPVYKDRISYSPEGKVEQLQGEAEVAEQEADEFSTGLETTKDVVSTFTRPIGKVGATLESIGSAARGIMGNEEERARSTEYAEKGVPMGMYGNVKPLGDNDSFAEDVGDVAMTGVETAAFLPVGKIAKPTGTAIKEGAEVVAAKFAERGVRKANKGITEALTPRLSPTEYTKLGKKGKIKDTSGLTPINARGDESVTRGLEAVNKVAADLGMKPTDIVKPTARATRNAEVVFDTIGDYSDNVVSSFLKKNPVDTNYESFIDYIGNVKPSGSLTRNKDAFEKFNEIREEVINRVAGSLKKTSRETGDFGASTDMNAYWDARKMLDNLIEEERKANVLGSPAKSGIDAAAKELRRGVADFISDSLRFPGQGEKLAMYRNTINGMRERGIEMDAKQLKELMNQLGLKPTGEAVAKQWDDYMKTMSDLYGAHDNLLTRAVAERELNPWQLKLKNNPGKVKAAKVVGGLLGAGTAANWALGN